MPLFRDDFPVNGPLENNPAWTLDGTAGTADVVAGQLRFEDSAGSPTAYVAPDTKAADQVVRISYVGTLDNANFPVCLRWKDRDNYVAFGWFDGSMRIYEVVEGLYVELAAVLADPSGTVWECESLGDQLAWRLDGVDTLTAISTAHQTSSRVAMLAKSGSDVVMDWWESQPYNLLQAFPSIGPPTASSRPTTATTHPVQLPPTVTDGDALIALVQTYADDPEPPVGEGWRVLDAVDLGIPAYGMFCRIGTAADSGAVSVFTTPGSRRFAAHVYRAEAGSWGGDIDTDIEVTTRVVGDANDPVFNSLAASWGSDDNTWIAQLQLNNNVQNGVTTGPDSDYVFDGDTNTGEASAGCWVSSGRREFVSATETVDQWLFSSAGVPSWLSNTIVVKPGAGVPPVTEAAYQMLI